MIERKRIVDVARTWIGTPYHHQAAVKGAGCDCLGLIRGVWLELYGSEPETPPPYTADWGEIGDKEFMLDAAKKHMKQIEIPSAKEGDVLMFRLRENSMAKHCSILSAKDMMIHAQIDSGVFEVSVSHWWERHIVAAFSFPKVIG